MFKYFFIQKIISIFAFKQVLMLIMTMKIPVLAPIQIDLKLHILKNL